MTDASGSGKRIHTPSLPDMRPLDRMRSMKAKLSIIVVVSVTLAAFITWLGLRSGLGPTKTFPLAISFSLAFTLLISRGITSPLREMTAAVRAMAAGDYSQQVRATSRDEVGQLAEAFNSMSAEIAHADQIRRDVIANVSHELRTPVAALHAQLENLVDGVVEPTPATLNTALVQTERLSRLISYLLDLSRIEAGAAELKIVPIPLMDFLDDAVGSLTMLDAGKNIDFVVDVQPAELELHSDPERLRQIVTNLVQNSIRHSPYGGSVTVTARQEGTEVVLEFLDEGPGIRKEDREKIFQRFARGGANATIVNHPTSGGTGIGLAIVRWAVDLHGGTVRALDALHGARIQIRLPQSHAVPRTDDVASQ
ncbi:HAMP domain-containing sensor histidine kinase [Timonella senegalensis]|uniref:HAMP domain-containing sensor histidine kinase n=2 Tax=Timonella senegalensis TaxID=1465825 RepID=UPI0028AE6506|nr:ATP-binding protein [Timonella senegalensis]